MDSVRGGRVAVVGAGIAGLAVARGLRDAGRAVTVLEKSRGTGGRCATRREGDDAWDHGAPHFAVTDPRFRAEVERWAERGAAVRWRGRRVRVAADGTATPREEAELWCGAPGMSAIGRALADGLDLRTGVRVAGLQRTGRAWQVRDDAGGVVGTFDTVVLAAPAPQAAALLPDGHPWRARMEAVGYESGVALLVRQRDGDDPGYDDAWFDEGPIARAVRRPDRHPGCWVLHGRAGARGPAWPHHRWRWARVVRPLGEPALVDAATGLAACGDGLRGDGVENAWLSARATLPHLQ